MMKVEPLMIFQKLIAATLLTLFTSVAAADQHNALIKTVEKVADDLEARVGFAA